MRGRMPRTTFYPSAERRKTPVDAATKSLLRMIKLNEQTIDAGKDICEKLHHQGNQITTITNQLARIDNNVGTSDDTVGRIRSCFGLGLRHRIAKFFHRNKTAQDVIDSKEIAKPKRTFFSLQKKRKKEKVCLKKEPDPFNTALDILDKQVAQIKKISTQIGSELTYHNQTLDVANQATKVSIENVHDIVIDTENA